MKQGWKGKITGWSGEEALTGVSYGNGSAIANGYGVLTTVVCRLKKVVDIIGQVLRWEEAPESRIQSVGGGDAEAIRTVDGVEY